MKILSSKCLGQSNHLCLQYFHSTFHLNRKRRNKLGSDFQYGGLGSTLKLLETQNDSFVLVIPDFLINHVNIYRNTLRDFDLLKEKIGIRNSVVSHMLQNSLIWFVSLIGSLQWPYNLVSNQNIPELMRNKIDKTTSQMMENGLHQFYTRTTTFLTKLRSQRILTVKSEETHALNISELKGPLIFCSYLIGFALFILLLEFMLKRHSS